MSKHHRLHAPELYELTLADGELFHDDKGQAVALPEAAAPLADTHGHLTHFHEHEASMALARAALAGVGLLGVPVDPVGDAADAHGLLAWLDETRAAAARHIDELQVAGVRTAATDPQTLLDRTYLWAGVHPYGAQRFLESVEAHEALDCLLASPLAVGVGEIGLDYGPYNRCDPAAQRAAFVEQLRLAHRLDLPVQLHLRDAEGDAQAQAHADALRILEQEGVPARGCDLHCYTSDERVMQPFVELGCFVAFGGAATFARSEDIRAAAVACPQELLLSETDSPYMAPVPLRGRECEPALVALSVQVLAEARAVAGVAAEDSTYQALWDNALRFFGC